MRPPHTPDRFLHVGHVQPNPRWELPRHAHPHHELIAVIQGRMRVTWARGEHDAVAGDLLLYPAGVAHQETSDPAQPAETVFIALSSPTLEGKDVVRVEDRRGRIRQALRWLLEDRLLRDAGQPAARRALLLVILDEFARLRSGTESGLVTRTHQWVRQHVAERLTLQMLAQQAGLSRFHFLRTYRLSAGRTPMRDVRRLRLAYARDLVLGSGLALKEIARLSGLGSAQAMSRAFRHEFGSPPGTLRRHVKRR
jgi:AraC-like DNA-binding protein